jgi:type IV pilus assembly protein PilO
MALLPRDPQQQKLVLLGILPVLLALLYFQFMYKPRRAEIDLLQTRYETLASQNKAAEAAIARYGPNLSRQLAVYEQHLAVIERLIPRRNDIPNLLVAMGEQAQANRVQWGGFVPAAEEAGAYYSRQSYEISVAGQYHDIGSYLAAVASLPRIVKPGKMDLKVTNARNPRDPSQPPLLRARFDVETYVLPAPGELPRDTTGAPAAGSNQ